MLASQNSDRHEESTGHILTQNFQQHQLVLDRLHYGEVHYYFIVTGLYVVDVILSKVPTSKQSFICYFLHCCLNYNLFDSLGQHVNLQIGGNANTLNFHFHTVTACCTQPDQIDFLLVFDNIPVWSVFNNSISQLESLLNSQQSLVSIE